MKRAIAGALPQEYPWADRIFWFDTLGSTSDHLKALARQGAPEGTVIIAGHQTGGRGRLGRSFHSPEGKGLYLSLLLRPQCEAAALMHLTCAVAVAACEAVEAASGLCPGIKWTNDLVHGGKKLGGILTELGFGPAGSLEYAVIGIGINCSHAKEDFPEELRGMAASLDMVTGRHTDVCVLAAALLNSLQTMSERLLREKEALLDTYRARCVTLGREVSVVRPDSVRHGKALSVDDQGALVVAFDQGTTEAVNAGEVSIRGMYGYV